jgi:hypothetical protein
VQQLQWHWQHQQVMSNFASSWGAFIVLSYIMLVLLVGVYCYSLGFRNGIRHQIIRPEQIKGED